jgi:xanthine dehydrogenase accessory factor
MTMAKEIIDILMEMRAKREPFAVATVVEIKGSASAKTGAKAVIDHQGRVVAGWVGGGCAESTTCHTALECMKSGQTTVIDIDLNDEVLGAGMPCGGSMRVYVEPMLPKPTLWIMGHGRVAECLCMLGDLMGFTVVVNDPTLDRGRYPAAAQLITDDINYSQLTPVADDFVVIATQHKGDHQSMKQALSSQAGYIALIASRKRSRLVLGYLRQEGFDETAMERVMAPAGIDIGARSPEEIALSVITEIVMKRRAGSGAHMRDGLMREDVSASGASRPNVALTCLSP